MKKKLLIFIPAYNVENLILNVLNDIPVKKLNSYEAEILLINDCSNDGTLKKVLEFKKRNKIKVSVLTNKTNLGYGAVQKLAYFYAIKNNFDFVVMLHGDGQYDPKVLLNLIKPIEKNWYLDINSHWSGKKKLTNTSTYPIEYQRPNISDDYWIINGQFTIEIISLDLEIYLGCENIFNFKQEDPIISWQDPFGQYFDISNIWGPTKGREFYLGIRLNI